MFNFKVKVLILFFILPFCISSQPLHSLKMTDIHKQSISSTRKIVAKKQNNPNLLVNGDFTDGETGWTFSVIPPAQATGAVVNGEFVVAITKAGTENWHIQLMQSGLFIEKGKKYIVSFEARAADLRNISLALIKDWTGPWTGYHYQTFAITTTKRKYKFEFYLNDPNDQNIKFYFDFGESSANVYIDNVAIYEKEITGTLVNGDFSNGDDHWITWVHSAASAYGSVQDGIYTMSISDGGDQSYHIQLMQTDLWIEQGKSYTVSFDAYAAQSRNIAIAIQHESAPWTLYHYKQVNLTTNRQTFHTSFTMSETTDFRTRFVFDLGLSDIDVYFDNVSLSLAEIPQPPFKRGINLADWFQQFPPFPHMHFKRYTMKNFEDVKSLGCDHIRLPLELFGMTGPAPEFKIKPLFFHFLDQAIDWAEQLELHLILDNHSSGGEITPDHIGQLKAVWAQLANRYKNRSDHIYYEILNEPHEISSEIWNDMQGQVIKTIRTIDKTHTIIVTPLWGNFANLHSMPVYDDPNLIYTFHFYDPGIFTHQGAYWVAPNLTNLANIPYPYDAARMPELPAEYYGTWVELGYNNYPNDGTDAWLQSRLDLAIKFRNERQVPVWCGEFGVYKINCQQPDRIRWLTMVRSYLEDNNISWAMWEYGDGFGIYENARELFEYDVNIPIIEALGLMAPPQAEFQLVPDTTGFIIYDDFVAQRIFHASWATGGDFNLDFYSEDNPIEGNYCLAWSGPDLYSLIGLRFSPLHDLTQLRAENYWFNLYVRCNSNNSKFELRFLDTDTDDPDDHPWRMHYTLDNTKVNWDGTWQHLQIPLSFFREQGAYEDGTWYNPQGKFDWSQIEKFEIGTDYHDLHNIILYLDDIRITKPSDYNQRPYLGAAVELPGLIEAENYDLGGQDIAYWDSDNGNSGGQYRQDDVDLEITHDTGGGYNVGWTVDGEWLAYTVDVIKNKLDIEVRIASKFSDGRITFMLDADTLDSVAIPNTGDWQSWQSLILEDVEFEIGPNKILKLLITNGNFNINWIKFTSGGMSGITNYNLPTEFALEQNFPNPFNPTTIIRYSLPKSSQVRLEIFNLLGQNVRTLIDTKQQPGLHHVEWSIDIKENKKISSGIYFYYIEAICTDQTFTAMKKMIIMR